jgi:DUF917 family protein
MKMIIDHQLASRSRLLSGFTDSKSFSINSQNIFSIGWGFGLSASGGGGSLVDGIGLIQTMLNSGFSGIEARSTILAPMEEAAVISGGMGAPSAIGGSLQDFVPSCLAALDALEGSGLLEAPITGITPIEAGPVNGMLPVYICWQSNGRFALYDCDGAGRAVPSLTNLLYDFEGITFSPSAQANIDGTEYNVDRMWINGAQAEEGLRDVIAAYGGAIGLAGWAQNGASLSTAELVLGTYGAAASRGTATYELRSQRSALYSYLASMGPNSDFDGLTWLSELNEVYRDPDGLANGYDKGYLVFGRDTIELGIEYRMYFLNENLFISRHFSRDGLFIDYVATAPSTISCYFSDRSPPDVLQCNSGDFIPYNTGDNDIIANLVGREIIVSVSSPSTLLYKENVKSSFVSVLNDYFSASPYNFNFSISDIFPTNGDIARRRRRSR